MQVCIRSCPLYYPGAIGFTTVNGEPKVGELIDKAWSITEKCRFKILDKKLMEDKEKPEATAESKTGESKSPEKKEPEIIPIIGS